MDFVKKNLVFSICALLAILSFLLGCVLVIGAAGKSSKAASRLESIEREQKMLATAEPAPSEENVTASEKNARSLHRQLKEIREDLKRGASLQPSTDGIRVMAGIQQFISDFQKKAEGHTYEGAPRGKDTAVQLPDEFGFGFERYLRDSAPPEEPARVAALDKQRQILTYVLDQLIDSNPESIESIRRELVEKDADDKSKPKSKKSQDAVGFSIDPAVSARVPGAIDTYAFKLVFTGQTKTLRAFLNKLAEFEMPIVVRSIEVDRPSGEDTLTGQGGIFDDFGGLSDTVATTGQLEPVVADTVSSFTLLIEFIEIVLPTVADDSEKEVEEDLS